jgi:hypothetical protein
MHVKDSVKRTFDRRTEYPSSVKRSRVLDAARFQNMSCPRSLRVWYHKSPGPGVSSLAGVHQPSLVLGHVAWQVDAHLYLDPQVFLEEYHRDSPLAGQCRDPGLFNVESHAHDALHQRKLRPLTVVRKTT